MVNYLQGNDIGDQNSVVFLARIGVTNHTFLFTQSAAGGFSDILVDLVGVWHGDDGSAPAEERRAPAFRVVSYATARGCCAAYFPETNVLVPLDSVAKQSNTPVSKSIVVRLERHEHVV